MTGMTTWINAVKLVSIVGEIANVPHIGGVATCVITLLETIQMAAQNDEDLQGLVESTRTTMDIVIEIAGTHGATSVPHFRHFCEDLEKYLKSVIEEMEGMDLKGSNVLKRFFRARNVSVVIAGFKQQVQKIKEDFLIRVTTDSRFAIADLEDKLIGLGDKLTGLENKLNASTVATIDAIETSQRNIQKEMRALGTLQNERMDSILSSISDLQARCSYMIRLGVVLVGDIQLLKALDNPSRSRYVDNRTPSEVGQFRCCGQCICA